MKRFLNNFFSAAICHVFVVVSSSAQPGKGNYMIGGSAGAGGGWVEQNESSGIRLNPEAGYFISNHIALGTSFTNSYSFYNRKFDSYTIGAGPFVKLFLFGSSSSNALFYRLNYSYLRAESMNLSLIQVTRGLENRIGYAYFLNRSVAIEPAFYYSLSGYGERLFYFNQRGSSEFGFILGLQVYIQSSGKDLKRKTKPMLPK